VKAFSPGPGGGSSGAQTFTIGSAATNDNFANAIAITTLPFTDTESTGAATTEVGETAPSSACIRGLAAQSAATHSIWYTYTPLSSGVVSFSSPGETETGIIQVVTGSALGALTPVTGGCSLDIKAAFAVSGAAATVKVSAGVTYHIMLSDYNGTGGTAVLTATTATPPVNDDFANAITVSTVGFGDTKATAGATTEVGEPVPISACTAAEAASTHSVWYKYTPGSSGTAVFNTNGSSVDSIIQVVTGTLGGFAAVTGGCADVGSQGVGETVTFSVTSGTTYFIMVSDWNGIGGTSVLNFASGPALVQDFAETGPGSGVTVTAGQTAMYTITVTPGPGGFSNAIAFSATGLPAASTPTFAPPTVTPGGSAATTTLSIATTLRSTFPGSPQPNPAPNPWKVPQFALWNFAFAAILLSLILFGKTERKRRLTPVMFVTAALLLVVGITGCGSVATGTPAGTSTITVTATSGAVSHATTVTLTVQ
jgi:hypothetical protein